jgi:hypothetical protein
MEMSHNVPLLTLSWALPLVGAAALLFVGNADGKKNSLFRWAALAISLVEFVVTLPAVGAVRPALRLRCSSSSACRGFRRSASTTTSASTVSACSWWC